jgi:hypothetical protein
MRKNGRIIRRTINDIVNCGAARRVQVESVTDSLRDFVVRTCRVAADAEAANDFPILIYRYASAEEDEAARNFAKPTPLSCRRRQEGRIKRIRLPQTI